MADPKEDRDGMLQAEPLVTGSQDLLSECQGRWKKGSTAGNLARWYKG